MDDGSGDEICHSDWFVAMRAGASWAYSPGEDIAFVAALDAQIAGFALRAFVDHLRLQSALGQHHHGVSRGVVAEAIAALAAGGRAPQALPAGLAVASEGEPTGGAGTRALNRHRFITQRGSPPAPDDAWRGP